MTELVIFNTIIIGGGVAGLTAGLYAARADLNPLIFAGDYSDKGGLLVKTSVVENYPGFIDGILGADLIFNMEAQAKRFGAVVIDKSVTKVSSISASSPKLLFCNKLQIFEITDDEGKKYLTQTVIIATGSKPNKLGLPKEDEFWGKGISSCATCDGSLFKKKRIIVVGGGDTAAEEATFLTKFSDVLLIHRRDSLRASAIMQKRVFDNPKIKVMFNNRIKELIGNDEGLTEVLVENVVTLEEISLPVDGLFYGLGLTPNVKLFEGLIDIDDGHIKLPGISKYHTATSLEGIFVAGDVSDKIYRQAVVAASAGCQAAMDVTSYLADE